MKQKVRQPFSVPYLQRGRAVLLPHGGLPEIVSPHLQKLIAETGGPLGPIGLQFISQPEKEKKHWKGNASDPLSEDEHEVAPGLIYKYKAGKTKDGVSYSGRALWTLTRTCASFCRFCTRGREVGLPPDMEGSSKGALAHTPYLSQQQMDQALSYIDRESKRGLHEIILSGGDPLTLPAESLDYAVRNLRAFQDAKQLRIVRIGTRLPVHNPQMITDRHFKTVGILKNPRLMVHVNHPAELTEETIRVLTGFRHKSQAVIMTQSVLLKGVNDSLEVLLRLFEKTAENGIIPYYVFQNDPVYWARHLTVPIDRAIKLWSRVRPLLSGVAATARFVIDVPDGYGKIPFPEGGAWIVDYAMGYRDFRNHRATVTDPDFRTK